MNTMEELQVDNNSNSNSANNKAILKVSTKSNMDNPLELYENT